MRILPFFALAFCLLGGVSLVAAEQRGAHCLKLGSTTVFAPRGEVYVAVEAECAERDFVVDSGVLAYLEVLVDEQTVLGRDVRVDPEAPVRQWTVAFDNLELVKDQMLLIRLTSGGEIIALQTVRVP